MRIVAATHRDLAAEAKAGRFREDLFYRLNVLPIVIPPLRERREDIPLLVDHFLARNNARLGTHIRGVDAEARRLLLEYAWPGNVRELENTIERAMVLVGGRSSCVAPICPSASARRAIRCRCSSRAASSRSRRRRGSSRRSLIRRALQKTKGNRTRAAEVLEISHRALLYKIKDYKITDV